MCACRKLINVTARMTQKHISEVYLLDMETLLDPMLAVCVAQGDGSVSMPSGVCSATCPLIQLRVTDPLQFSGDPLFHTNLVVYILQNRYENIVFNFIVNVCCTHFWFHTLCANYMTCSIFTVLEPFLTWRSSRVPCCMNSFTSSTGHSYSLSISVALICILYLQNMYLWILNESMSYIK